MHSPVRPPWALPLDIRYVIAGLALTILGGTALGVSHLLLVHGLHRGSPPTHVQAHAHAQVFGLFAAFLAGFGYQLLPRFVRRPLPYPRLNRATFWLLVGGAVLHFVGQPANRWSWGFWLMAASGPLLAAGLVCFTANVVRLLEGAAPGELYISWLRLGSIAFAISGVMAAVMAVHAGLTSTRLYDFSAAQALWTVAVHGGITTFTLGVAARMVTAMMGGGELPRFARWVGPLMLVGITVQALAYAVPLSSALRAPALLAGRVLVGLFLLVAAGAFFRAFRRPLAPAEDPFIESAIYFSFGSLFVAGLARLAISVAELLGSPPDVLATDAERHLVTIGFLLVLVTAMASRLVPGLRGVPLAWSGLRWPALLLLQLSVVTRVAQVLTLFGLSWARYLSAASGMFAWAGLILLGAMLAKTATSRQSNWHNRLRARADAPGNA